MIIYRIFDSFITMYTYTKGCYNTGNFEVLHSNAKLYAAAVLSGVGVWAILELLLGFGLYAMAKKRNFEKRYMAFIPFVNMLYAGRLAGETRLFGQRMKHAGVFVMAAQIIALLVGAFSIFAEVTLNANYLLKAVSSADGRTLSLVYVTESGGAPASRFAMFLIGYVNVASYVLSIVELVYSIFLFITASALFRKYAPASYTGLAFLSLFIPAAFPIIVFVLRNKQPVDYAEYIRKKREAYYRRYGAPGGYGGYNNSPYGGGYGGGTYGSAGGADPYRGNGEGNRSGGSADDEPFSEFGGSGNSSGNRADGGAGGNDDSPFSDIDG